jgi:hypothetical protein
VGARASSSYQGRGVDDLCDLERGLSIGHLKDEMNIIAAEDSIGADDLLAEVFDIRTYVALGRHQVLVLILLIVDINL